MLHLYINDVKIRFQGRAFFNLCLKRSVLFSPELESEYFKHRVLANI